jgi:hypothetical protein
MIVIQCANMHPNTPAEQRLICVHRKRIKTSNSRLEKMGIARIHARLTAGDSRMIAAALCALCVCQTIARPAISDVRIVLSSCTPLPCRLIRPILQGMIVQR